MNITIPCAFLAAVIAVSAVGSVPNSMDDQAEPDGNATQIAKAWFRSLMAGETVVTTSLSDVPFSFDRKKEIKTHTDLKERFDRVVAQKGKRNLKPTSVRITASAPEQVEVILMIEDEGIVVVVKPGEAFRVVGFSD